MFYYTNFWIPLVIFWPSLLFIKWPPKDNPRALQEKSGIVVTAAEGIGRLGVMIIPFFYEIRTLEYDQILSLTAMAVLLIFYYYGWFRYLKNDRKLGVLFSPQWGIPVPMAVSPVLYFGFASLLLHSWTLLLSSLIFGAGHILASLNTYRQIKDDI
ncbi:hypothetical protein [Paenibacillus sp. DYY-L-2]|uniref:hypothetical protein n=1 Tax=Paenibacillus sp. DYY-L-2 TaxID=3447013 RepID=UPI003F50AB7D